MGNLFKAIKAGAAGFADGMGPGQYTACGKKVSCPHCGKEEFAEGSAQLNTAGMTFFNLDWANKSSTTLACMECGRVQWFMKKPERL